MSTPPSSGRKRVGRTHNVEDETLSQIAKEAEARLAQKRAARIEAREIRMRELERQQREAQEKPDWDDKAVKSNTSAGILPSSQTNHSSVFSGSDQGTTFNVEDFSSSQELKNAFVEMEEKYRQAMVHTAQLDNERSQLHYQIEQLRDLLEEEEDAFYRLNSQHKRTCQELERQKRSFDSLEKKCYGLQEALQQRDELIQEQGLVLVGDGNREPTNHSEVDYGYERPGLALVTPEAAKLLESAGDGPLDLLLKRLAEEKQDLMDQVRRLKNDLEEEQRKGIVNGGDVPIQSPHHIPEMELLEVQREANRQVNEYKLKLQKCEQDVGSCQGNIARLESQLSRVKQTCELYERNEDEMRAEKRKLMRDLRTALDRIEEMEMTNTHLEKRLERIRASRAAMGQT